MNRLKGFVIALALTFGGLNAGGIPTFDGVNLASAIQQFIGQIKEYAQEAMRFEQEFMQQYEQLQAATGIDPQQMSELMDTLSELEDKYNDYREKAEMINNIINDPERALTGDIQDLLNKLQVYDNCAGYTEGSVERNICYGDFKTKVADIVTSENYVEELGDSQKKLEKNTKRLTKATTSKQIQDATAKLQAQAIEVQIAQNRYDAQQKMVEQHREAVEVTRKQQLDKIAVTPATIDFSNISYDN
jgi:DNA repair exonuclease SbcCD ATPase subunit